MREAIVRGTSEIRKWSVATTAQRLASGGTSKLFGRIEPPPVAAPAAAAPAVPKGEDPAALALAEAERIRADARQWADEEREQARQEGLLQGRQEAEAELDVMRGKLQDLAASIHTAFTQFCHAQIPSLAEVAGAAAEQIVRTDLRTDPSRIDGIVREALEHITTSSQVVVYLHPDDLHLVEQSFEVREYSRPVVFRPDPDLERGGCWISSQQGEIDATLEGRISRMKLAVAEA